jgi:CRP-like cAMP-binding protein
MEQDWGESVFLLRSGLAKVRTYTMDGDEVVMSLLGAGDVFGEMAALDGAARSADVVALTPLCLVKLRAVPFAALLAKQAGFALALARLEAGRLRDLNRRFALQSADATSRLLDALAYLARKNSGSDADPQALIPPLAQREIALLAGLARETASRTLSKLRQRNVVVEEEGGLRLVDLQPLQKRGLLD